MLVLETVVGIGREYAGGKAIKAMARVCMFGEGDPQGDPGAGRQSAPR